MNISTNNSATNRWQKVPDALRTPPRTRPKPSPVQLPESLDEGAISPLSAQTQQQAQKARQQIQMIQEHFQLLKQPKSQLQSEKLAVHQLVEAFKQRKPEQQPMQADLLEKAINNLVPQPGKHEQLHDVTSLNWENTTHPTGASVESAIAAADEGMRQGVKMTLHALSRMIQDGTGPYVEMALSQAVQEHNRVKLGETFVCYRVDDAAELNSPDRPRNIKPIVLKPGQTQKTVVVEDLGKGIVCVLSLVEEPAKPNTPHGQNPKRPNQKQAQNQTEWILKTVYVAHPKTVQSPSNQRRHRLRSNDTQEWVSQLVSPPGVQSGIRPALIKARESRRKLYTEA